MINQQLLDFINQQLQQGASKEEIRNILLTNSWQEKDINEVFQVHQPTSRQTLSSLPSASNILGRAWSIYKKRLGTLLGITIIPILIIVALVVILSVGGFLSIRLLSSKIIASGIGLVGLLIILAVVILFFIVFFVSQSWGQVALLYAVKDNQEGIGVIESYRKGWHKLLPYCWVSALVGLIVFCGGILFVIPGIIFAIWYSLAVFVLVAEDLKGMKALSKSKEYVKGKWGGVFWRFLFIGFISFIISLILILIVSILKIPFGDIIYRFAIGLFLTPLMITYSFLVYSDLKAFKRY